MKKVIVLAGGKGERLRPHTEDRPKCMIPVMGKPLLGFTLQWLSTYGYEDVYLTCGYRHEAIKDHFGDGAKLGIKIRYIIEDEPLGRGGAIKKAMSSMAELNEPVLAINGDIVTNLNLNQLAQKHNSSDVLATIVTVPLRSPYGVVDIAPNGAVAGFREKPELPFWINSGVYLLSPSLCPLLPDAGDHEDQTFPQLAEDGKLATYSSRDFWRTVDTVKDLGELRVELEQLFFGAFFSRPVAPGVVPV